MLFNSLHFLIFFPVVFLLYYLVRPKMQNSLLLAASIYFYGVYFPKYLLVLAAVILIDFYLARAIQQTAEEKGRRAYLILSISANCLILFFFKYFNFFSGSISDFLSFVGAPTQFSALKILLPLGLSFHTLQAMSYTIEVYRGTEKAERNLLVYSLYVFFFPQLVAGPIERPHRLLPQLRTPRCFSESNVLSGLRTTLYGFLLKVVLADRLGPLVDIVYSSPRSFTGVSFVIATCIFAFQIYADFAGYSLIALGSAKMLGIDLVRNFNSPYLAGSISEFWRRWHVSLSSWFRDYVYIPLGGSRCSRLRKWRNIFVVFFLSGLWHGANWTFVVWGLLHGLYLIIFDLLKNAFARIPYLIRKFGGPVLTFILVAFSWIFFRAQNLSDAWYVASHLFSGWADLFSKAARPALHAEYFSKFVYLLGSNGGLIGGIVLIILLLIWEGLVENTARSKYFFRLPLVVRWGVYLFVIWGLVNFGMFANRPFIYFIF